MACTLFFANDVVVNKGTNQKVIAQFFHFAHQDVGGAQKARTFFKVTVGPFIQRFGFHGKEFFVFFGGDHLLAQRFTKASF